MQTMCAWRLIPLPLAAVATLWLAACQGSGTDRPVTSWERPAPAGSNTASSGQLGADVHGVVSTETQSGAQSHGDAPVLSSDVTFESPETVVIGGVDDEGKEELDKTGSSESSGEHTENSADRRLTPGGTSLTEGPRDNPKAADLLDYWGHRGTQGIVEGLNLSEPTPDADAADLTTLQEAAQNSDEAVVAPDLQEGDEILILGTERGVTYGRWTGGPADTLPITFDLSNAGPLMRDNPAFRAMLERAGKSWSNRIADTWTPWIRLAGETKGFEPNGEPVYVGDDGEISTGVEIPVTYGDLPGRVAGQATTHSILPPGESWEPRFAWIEIDTDYFQQAEDAKLLRALAHEIGHVLGAWMGERETQPYAPYTDAEAGTWTGPNVVNLHGRPAPFQDHLNPYDSIGGERDPSATNIDFGHSGVCSSLMAYCSWNWSAPLFLPQAIDFAFLQDLGMTVTEKTERPETYGLAGWTDYAGFTVAVSRDLQVGLANPKSPYGGTANAWSSLDVTDLLYAGVDAFGYRSTGDFGMSYPLEGSFGKVCYAGGLIGTAIDLAALPPVIGDANLTVDLDSLDGTADFTSLEVYSDLEPMIFAGGALHYPFELSENAIVGTDESATLSADFYGPGHEDVAGTLHDPQEGLLASFGATHDNRPHREEVIASADYLVGWSDKNGSANPSDDGRYTYVCETEPDCQSRHPGTSTSAEWNTTTRDSVLAATAGWDRQSNARLFEDRRFVRIERQSGATTDSLYVFDGYTGTMEHSTFGVGFEEQAGESTVSSSTTSDLFNVWTGVQGSVAESLPAKLAQWSGPMLGFQHDQAGQDNSFVEGRAIVDFHLSTNRMDVAFSQVFSRNDERKVPDFSFDGLQPQADGTFAMSDIAGSLRGALFGPAHEEVAGAFHHNAASITGSFGAQRMSDIVTLTESGSVQLDDTITITDDFGTYSPYAYDNWGFWGNQFGENLFGVLLEKHTEPLDILTIFDPPTASISGTLSGSNPATGGAVWSGGVRAVDTSHGGYLPVSGSARLEVDFADATVDANFADFDSDHEDISWDGMQMNGGSFQDAQNSPTIEGAFYGSGHQGAAGEFERNNLRGVFGAVRD